MAPPRPVHRKPGLYAPGTVVGEQARRISVSVVTAGGPVGGNEALGLSSARAAGYSATMSTMPVAGCRPARPRWPAAGIPALAAECCPSASFAAVYQLAVPHVVQSGVSVTVATKSSRDRLGAFSSMAAVTGPGEFTRRCKPPD